MTAHSLADRVRELTADSVETAVGRRHREDEVHGGSGGPAGNAKLTAWTGLVLLVLFVAELITLLDVHGLISWHIALGTLLIPPALLKTATTSWRIVRYYGGDRSYRAAGPPPALFRVLGPLVVLSTLAVLGTGLALVVVGQASSRTSLVSVLGQRVDAITLHQASFAVWAVATGLHTLGRTVPAVQLAVLARPGRARIPGGSARLVVLILVAAVAVAAAVIVLSIDSSWLVHFDRHGEFGHR